VLSVKVLYHLDLYRIHSEQDLKTIGLSEILEDKDGVVAIEWPEKLASFLPEKRIEIRFNTSSENEREIQIEEF
jgi:tRNA threonylcarbamoyladenosine biosynthesis protein TsaE